jgi:hypothetical protein
MLTVAAGSRHFVSSTKKEAGMKILRSLFIFIVIVGSVGSTSKSFSESAPIINTEPAQKAAEKWLLQVDAENYPEAWKGFSSFFLERMSLEMWKQQIQSARAIFGKLESRKLKNATPATTLPGAPDGDYVTIQYDTAFEKKKSALETVTLKLEDDGKWGVIGYYIK